MRTVASDTLAGGMNGHQSEVRSIAVKIFFLNLKHIAISGSKKVRNRKGGSIISIVEYNTYKCKSVCNIQQIGEYCKHFSHIVSKKGTLGEYQSPRKS